MAAGEDSLDRLLHKATNPSGLTVDWIAINAFTDRVNESPETVQSALRLLVHRIQSSDENEALNGLLVLDVCAEKCGPCFQDEIGKFRFLNELIKLVSPKYLGSRTSPTVKRKVIEILFNWTQTLKEQPKIKDAYQMLKWQKVVVEDPILEVQVSPRPKDTIFDDEEKAKLLQKLLHSENQEDIQAANRLIKSMVKENEKRVETVAQRNTVLETVHNNASVLRDMMTTYATGSTSNDDIELMKELYLACDKLRPTLFRLASDTDDKDESLGDILRANDELARVIEQYQKLFVSDIPSLSSQTPKSNPEQSEANVSLLDLGSPVAVENLEKSKTNTVDEDWLTMDDALLGTPESISKAEPKTKREPTENENCAVKNDLDELGVIFSSADFSANLVEPFGMNHLSLLTPLKSSAVGSVLTDIGDVKSSEVGLNENKKASKGLEDLDALGISLLKQALPANTSVGAEFYKPSEKVPMNLMKKPIPGGSPSSQHQASPNNTTTTSSPVHEPPPLTDIFVPLDSIHPGTVPPLTLYDKNGLTVVIHFGKENPKLYVSVMVVTAINKSSDLVTSFFFQAAVPKVRTSQSMKVKLQPPSATQMPAFNPILPPAAITQVMLLSKSSSKEKVKLKYKINYTINGKTIVDIGEIDNLPLT